MYALLCLVIINNNFQSLIFLFFSINLAKRKLSKLVLMKKILLHLSKLKKKSLNSDGSLFLFYK